MSITMDDIAREAGVTKATVSMVFRNRSGISEATRTRVLNLAQNHGYTPSVDRQRRGRVHHGQIGVLFISNNQPRLGGEHGAEYLLGMLRGIQAEAEAADSGVVFCTATSEQLREGKIPASMWRQLLDALIIRGSPDAAMHEWLERKKIRYALIDCAAGIRGHDVQICIDNIQAMGQLVTHLHEQGCRKFATITGSLSHINGCERLAGLQTALTRIGLPLPPVNIFVGSTFNEEAGRQGAEEFIRRGAEFDALVCQNDLIAAEAIKTLAEHGIAAPKDVKVTGFDNMTFGSMLAVPLTSVDSKPAALGRLSVQLLMSQLDSPRRPDPLCVRVPCEVVVRESSLAADGERGSPS